MTRDRMLQEYVDEVCAEVPRDHRLLDKCEEIAEALWTLEYRSSLFGSVCGDAFRVGLRDGDPWLEWLVHTVDTDTQTADGEGEQCFLRVGSPVTRWLSGREHVQQVIHSFLTHEADEQIWFEGERPFYPEHAPAEMSAAEGSGG